MSDISFEAENVSRYKPDIVKQHGQLSIHSDNLATREQLTEYPILPILKREVPLLDWIKNRETVVPRVKFLGAFGVIDPQKRHGAYGGPYSVERRLPRPYPVSYTWPPEKDVGRLPAVMSILTGPEHSVIAQPVTDVTTKVESARISVQM